MTLKEYYDYLVEWTKEKVKNANCEGVVLGVSGGIDSALVAAIAKAAFPKHSLGIIMPILSNPQDLKDALKVVEFLDLNFDVVDLGKTYQTMTSDLPVINKLALVNIKPRLRMTTLYAYAQEKKYLVLGTDNYAESYLGYFTKYGDGGVDLLPISQLTKGDVWKLAKFLGMPQNIIEKAPSAGLWEGQTDEAELGFTYQDFDQFVEDSSKLNPAIINKIQKQHYLTQHKREEIPKPKKYFK